MSEKINAAVRNDFVEPVRSAETPLAREAVTELRDSISGLYHSFDELRESLAYVLMDADDTAEVPVPTPPMVNWGSELVVDIQTAITKLREIRNEIRDVKARLPF